MRLFYFPNMPECNEFINVKTLGVNIEIIFHVPYKIHKGIVKDDR